MTIDTPLDEVTAHLPTEVCAVLLTKPNQIRVRALLLIRQALVLMEKEGAVLDPVSYRAVVYALAVTAVVGAEYAQAVAEAYEVVAKAIEL